LKAAQRLWETKGLPHVLVNVTFNKDTLFPKNCWAKVAEKLVACAQQALPPVGRQALVGYGSPPRLAVNVGRPTEVDTMSISRDSFLPRTWWGLSTGGTVPSLTREIVQGAIDEKLERLKEYRKKAPTIWLIVGMESQRFSDYFVIDDPSVLDEIDTRGFDR